MIWRQRVSAETSGIEPGGVESLGDGSKKAYVQPVLEL